MPSPGQRAALALLVILGVPTLPTPAADPDPAADLAAARALFERNLRAIRDRDRDAYLACYLDAPSLVRTGPEGPVLGYEEFAAAGGDSWPEVFESRDLRLIPVRPGVVYGTYRYRIVQDGVPSSGISERIFVRGTEGWRIAVTTAFPAPPGTPPPPLALVGATMIDGTGSPPTTDAVVMIRGGRIDCAGSRERCAVPDGVEIRDLSGKFLTPGLIDAHVHFSQTGWVDGRPDAVDVRERHPYARVIAGLAADPVPFFRAFLCSGVTGVFDVGGYPWTWDLRGPAEHDPWAPHVEASGPLLSTLDFWLNLPGARQFLYMADEAAVREGIEFLAAFGSRAVKVWYNPTETRDAEELAGLVRLAGEEARRLDLRLIVHATGLAEAKVAVRAGADLLVHSVTDQEVDDEFLEMARRQGTILTPTLVVHQGYLDVYSGSFDAGRYPLDCVGEATRASVQETAELHPGGPDPARVERARARAGEALRVGSANLLRLHRAGIPIAMGTDAGNPLTLHGPSVHAEMKAMQDAGLSPTAVLIAATRDAARAMGRGEDLGTLEAGKAADLLVVGKDPTRDVGNLRFIEAVIRAGVVHSRDELLPARP